MQFNDTTNKSGIIQQIEQTCKLDDGAISGNSQLLKVFTNSINNWVGIVGHWIKQVDGEWGYDDKNHGNMPIEVYSLVDSQFDYGLKAGGETDMVSVKKVEVHDVATGEYYDLDYYDEADRPDNEFGGVKGKPAKYYFNGGSIIFDIKPDTTLVDLFRVTYDRNESLFASSDTTKTPGFDIKFHPILVYGPSMEWALTLGRAEVVNLCKTMLYGTDPEVDIGLKRMLQEAYSRRLVQKLSRVGRRSKNRI
jgi:hypothetical protein